MLPCEGVAIGQLAGGYWQVWPETVGTEGMAFGFGEQWGAMVLVLVRSSVWWGRGQHATYSAEFESEKSFLKQRSVLEVLFAPADTPHRPTANPPPPASCPWRRPPGLVSRTPALTSTQVQPMGGTSGRPNGVGAP